MTPEMLRTLTFVQAYHARHGVAPTVREIAAHEGGKSLGPVSRRIKALVERGHLVRLYGSARNIAPAQYDLTNIPLEKLLGELERRRALHG
jgi:SOS-response transcriptional repressor LexA